MTRRNVQLLGGVILLVLVSLAWLGPTIWDAARVNWLGLQVLSGQPDPGASKAVDLISPDAEISDREKSVWAMLAVVRGQPQRAIPYLNQVVRSSAHERVEVWRLQLAQAYRAAGRVKEAQQIVVSIPDVKQGVVTQCRTQLISYGDAEEIEFWCPILEDLGGLTAEEECLLGQYYSFSGQPALAEGAFGRAVAEADISAECLYQFGEHRRREHKEEEARALFERAFYLDPSSRYLRAIGRTYEAIGEPEHAMDSYQQAYSREPTGSECAESLRAIGDVYYYWYEDYAPAASYYRLAIQCDVYVDVSAYWLLANSERRLGNSQAALEAYRVVQHRLAGDTYLLYWRHDYAAYLVELGQLTEANQVYRSILQDAPDDLVAREALNQLSGQGNR